MFQTKVAEKIKTHILCSTVFSFENYAFYEIMWKNIVRCPTAAKSCHPERDRHD